MVALAFVVTLAAQPAAAQQPTQPQQKEHVVRKGDTLWDLARFYLNDPYRWPMIYDANRNVVENPHWIYPEERIVIPGMVADAALIGTPLDTISRVSSRSRFYTPPVEAPTSTIISSEFASIPLVQPLEWLAAPWIADSAALGINSSVYKPADPRYINDKLKHIFHPRDKLFLTMEGLGGVQKDDRLLAVRLSRNLRGIGWIVEPKGIVRVDSLGANTALASLVNQFGDLKLGDVLIPLPAVPPLPADRLIEVTGGPTGAVIEFLVEQPLVGTTDYAFVDLGTAQGVAIGDELVAFVPRNKPSSTEAGTITEQTVARLRVIRVMDQTATVRVTRLDNASLKRGLPVRVARKAP